MFVLLFLYASVANAKGGLENSLFIDTRNYVRQKQWWWWIDIKLPNASSDCRIYAKNGNSPTESSTQHWSSRHFLQIYFSDVNIDGNTWIWTSCDDALGIDRVSLYDKNKNKREWGKNDGWVYCLSTDKNDDEFLNVEGYQGDGRCFRTLLFDAKGKIWYYIDENWTPDGRRALAPKGVPALEDVQACEKDENTPQKVCNGLVDKILSYDAAHEENLVQIEEPQDDGGMAMVTSSPATSIGVDTWALYGFAALGFAFATFQGAKFVMKKTREEFAPIKAQDEL